MKKFYHLIFVFLLTSGITHLAEAQNIFTVTTTGDNGNNATPSPGSLREAILLANTTPNVGGFPDTIKFNITGAGVHVLAPINNALLAITESVVIDGYSQGTQGTLGSGFRVINIAMDGSSIPTGDGLTVSSPDVTIEGMAIYNFNGNGILVSDNAGVNNLFVWGCFIGLDATGAVPSVGLKGNAVNGILVSGTTNQHTGIHIGTNLDNVNDTSEGNAISSNNPNPLVTNDFDGIQLNNCISSNISGNYLGVLATGTGNAGNGRNGVALINCAPANATQKNLVGTNGDNVNDAIEGNIISNNGNGVAILNANFTTVAGNLVGIDKNGAAAGNVPVSIIPLGSGIIIWGSTNCVIGTDGDGSAGDANEKNYVTSNAWNGISLYEQSGFGAATTNNKISGNFVGVGLDGVTARGNLQFGIGIVSNTANGVFNNIIGSNDDGSSDGLEGNVDANNGVDGIGVFTSHNGLTSGNRFSRNSYYNNGRFAININVNSPQSGCNLPNLCAPSAPGSLNPNDFFPHPVLDQVTLSGTTVTITGWALKGSTIQFYLVDGNVSKPCGETLDFESGKTYLISDVEGGVDDTDPTNTTYTTAQEGTNPGTSCAAERFSFAFQTSQLAGTVSGNPGFVALGISDGVNNTAPVGSTSQFSAMVISTGALPVTLVSFDAVSGAGKVTLKWSTASESNSDYFDVERSADGANFSLVGSVPAKGNSNTLTNYTLVDANPLDGVSYYRLKQVDRDGKFTYSKVIIIRSSGISSRVLLSPNPTKGSTTITLSLTNAERLQVRLLDNTGRIARTYSVAGVSGINQIHLNDLSNLPSGVYNIEIIGLSTHVRERLLKN